MIRRLRSWPTSSRRECRAIGPSPSSATPWSDTRTRSACASHRTSLEPLQRRLSSPLLSNAAPNVIGSTVSAPRRDHRPTGTGCAVRPQCAAPRWWRTPSDLSSLMCRAALCQSDFPGAGGAVQASSGPSGSAEGRCSGLCFPCGSGRRGVHCRRRLASPAPPVHPRGRVARPAGADGEGLLLPALHLRPPQRGRTHRKRQRHSTPPPLVHTQVGSTGATAEL